MKIIAFAYWPLLLIVMGVGIIRYKKLTRPFKVLAWSVIISFFLELLSYIFAVRFKNNAPIAHIENIVWYIFYAIIYYDLLKNEKLKKTILVSIVIVTVFGLVNALFLQPFHVFPTYTTVVTQTLYVIFSLLLYKQMLLYPSKINIIEQSAFWYNTAILFYATTMFVNLGLGNYVAEHHVVDYIIFYFWYFILYVFFILIGVALLTDNKEILGANA